MNYFELTKKQKFAYLKKVYCEENLSFTVIANQVGTYPNKIRRDAISFGIQPRDKSQAQKLALTTGRHKHPTAGKKHSADTKIKISDKRALAWKNMSKEDRQAFSDTSKEQWKNMSEDEKKNLHRLAGEAVRQAAKEGSKLEKFLHQGLINAGYMVNFHKEYILKNEKLQLDLWLPKLNIAIEIDGPSHFSPIWGVDKLTRNIRTDNIKTGLILGRGMVLIRIKQVKSLSQKLQRTILQELLQILKDIESKFPPEGKRLIYLER